MLSVRSYVLFFLSLMELFEYAPVQAYVPCMGDTVRVDVRDTQCARKISLKSHLYLKHCESTAANEVQHLLPVSLEDAGKASYNTPVPHASVRFTLSACRCCNQCTNYTPLTVHNGTTFPERIAPTLTGFEADCSIRWRHRFPRLPATEDPRVIR